jgi:hypothetical protein
METKYTAFITPAVLLARGVFVGRLRLGLTACGLAAAAFLGWEALVAWKYGESHFWFQLQESGSDLLEKRSVTEALIPILGYVAPAVGMLGLAALGAPRSVIALSGAAIVLGIGLAATGTESTVQQQRIVWAWPIFGGLGVLVGCVGCWLAGWSCWKGGKEGRFLVLWLGLELAGYFALTPFPAVRRVLGLVVVLTLLAGRVWSCRVGRVFEAHRVDPLLARRAREGGIIVLGMAMGLLYFIVDVYDARAQMLGAHGAAREIGGGRVWYAGHWGFQYYAEEAGMMPVVPEQSRLQPGDWLVLPGEPIVRQGIRVSKQQSTIVFAVEVEDPVPWRVVMGYYGGGEPLRQCAGPRLRVEVRRVVRPWTPQWSGE